MSILSAPAQSTLPCTLELAQTLIGRTIHADGWHYDNGGFISGVITKIDSRYGGLEYTVTVEPDHSSSMKTYTFKAGQMLKLITEGKLPKANQLLNTGTNAELVA